MKNLILQQSLLEQLDKNFDGDEFKDFILKLNDYFLNGVEPEFDGIKKMLFEISKPYYAYLDQKYDNYIVEKNKKALGVETVDDLFTSTGKNKYFK